MHQQKKQKIPFVHILLLFPTRTRLHRSSPFLYFPMTQDSGNTIPVAFFPIRKKRPLLNFRKKTALCSADIWKVDARFVSLIRWLGDNHIHVRLSGQNTAGGLCSLQDPGNSLWRRNQAFRRGRFPAVYDRDDFSASNAPEEENRG